MSNLTNHERPKVLIIDDSTFDRNRSKNVELVTRTSGYKRPMEAMQSAPEQIPAIIERALEKRIEASYVLMDTWFTQQPLIQAIVEQGLDVIGMVKNTKQRYQVGEQMMSLKELY